MPLTDRKFNSIWVIVDRFNKSAHYIPVHTFYRDEKYAELYVSRILCLHGMPKSIISHWGALAHCSLLGAVACFLGDASDPQLSIASVDRWSGRDGELVS
jgi:hypothetical protein